MRRGRLRFATHALCFSAHHHSPPTLSLPSASSNALSYSLLQSQNYRLFLWATVGDDVSSPRNSPQDPYFLLQRRNIPITTEPRKTYIGSSSSCLIIDLHVVLCKSLVDLHWLDTTSSSLEGLVLQGKMRKLSDNWDQDNSALPMPSHPRIAMLE